MTYCNICIPWGSTCIKMLAILPFSFLALVKASSKVIKRNTETISFRQTIAFAEKTVENVQSWTLILSLSLVVHSILYVLSRLVSQAKLKVPPLYAKLSIASPLLGVVMS